MRLIVMALAATALAFAADGDEYFEKRIRPVLSLKCYSCHSSKLREPKANLRLDTRGGLRKGGDSGAAIEPGKPAESRLLKAISYTDLHLRMPPTGKLDDKTIADFRDWIAMGAPDPREDAEPVSGGPRTIDLDRGRKFWAFQPLTRTDPPAVKNEAWPRARIDRYVLAKLEQKGFTPAPEAERGAWLRRVTFDLTGLPPTAENVAAFESDKSDGAHERVVDRLLASPAYGERWGRHWLDLVRFAETNGHEFDNNKLDAWQYRDYVIRAMNEDLPYDQFVREHVAGDLLAKPRISRNGQMLESPLGTSFYFFGEVLNSATDSVKSKADSVDNQLDVISKTFLGLTVACARCHDHKFDPIPTKDYYGMAGVMHSTGMREVVIDSRSRAAAIHSAHQQVKPLARKPGKRTIELRPGDEIWEDFDGPGFGKWYPSGEAFSVPPRDGVIDSAGRGANELVGSLTSEKFRMPKMYVHVRLAATKGDKAAGEREPVRLTLVADDFKSLHYLGTGKGEFEWATFRMTLPHQRICYFELVDRSRTGNIAVDAIVFSDEKEPPEVNVAEKENWPDPPATAGVPIPESNFGMVAWDEAPGDVKLHIRGSHQNLGEVVPRHFLRVVEGAEPALNGSGRLELAEWLTSRANPLTARVMVNRVWAHHFGQGLVRTADNFGLTGERPVNRELLDDLASRFMENGWRMKPLHREIVLSAAYRMSSRQDAAAYRMSSRQDAAAQKLDPRNDFLHHYPVRRLEAEAIRDAMLAVSGSLNPEMYGPSVVPHISAYQNGRGKPSSGPLDGENRRSLYVQVRRNFLTPMFLVFDYPLPISTTGVRSVSTVPSQALMMMNNEFVLQQAKRWGEHVEKESGDTGTRVRGMFLRAFGRQAGDAEVKDSVEFLAQGRSYADLAHVLFNSAEFLYVQ